MYINVYAYIYIYINLRIFISNGPVHTWALPSDQLHRSEENKDNIILSFIDRMGEFTATTFLGKMSTLQQTNIAIKNRRHV